MKIRDFIKLLDGNTDIYIYVGTERCYLADSCEDECDECKNYFPKKDEWCRYSGKAENCPILLSEDRIEKIDTFYHSIQITKRKSEERIILGIKVKV